MSDAKHDAAGQVAEEKLIIRNKQGIHARPAALIVKTAAKFHSDIVLIKDDFEAPAKSLLALLGLEGESGSAVVVRANGRDAAAAVTAMRELFDSKFSEP